MTTRAPPRIVLLAVVSAGLHAAALGLVGPAGTHRERGAPNPGFHAADGTLAGSTVDVESTGLLRADEVVATTPAGNLVSSGTASPQRGRSTGRALDGRDHAPVRIGGAPAAPLFGAVGVRYAVDLATAFAHAFPQAASADPGWLEVPFGNAGSAELELTLDEDGHIVEADLAGAPSVPLRRGVERTLALLGPRAFTASGAQTKLRASAKVTRDAVHDGLHGDVFALSGGSFAGRTATAFFALPPGAGPGRRVDVEFVLLP
ncbi:MAG: hypothetical protein ABTD50_11645 [Polyangiaceae bacterium]